MVKSMTMAAKVPHFHYLEEINCNSLMKLKASFQNDNSDADVKHTFLPFLIKSLSMALTKYPIVNSSFNKELYEVILKGIKHHTLSLSSLSWILNFHFEFLLVHGRQPQYWGCYSYSKWFSCAEHKEGSIVIHFGGQICYFSHVSFSNYFVIFFHRVKYLGM